MPHVRSFLSTMRGPTSLWSVAAVGIVASHGALACQSDLASLLERAPTEGETSEAIESAPSANMPLSTDNEAAPRVPDSGVASPETDTTPQPLMDAGHVHYSDGSLDVPAHPAPPTPVDEIADGSSTSNMDSGTDSPPTPPPAAKTVCDTLDEKLQACGIATSHSIITSCDSTNAFWSCIAECMTEQTCSDLEVPLCGEQPRGVDADCWSECYEVGPLYCDNGTEGYYEPDRCDLFQDCSDGTDERDCDYFACPDGTFVNPVFVCDGRDNCPDGEDEANCAPSMCSGGGADI